MTALVVILVASSRPQSLAANLVFYLEDCLARGESPRTVEGKASSLRFFVAWASTEGLKRVAGIRLQQLESYRRHVHAYRQPYTGQPLDIATVRNRLTAVKVLFRRLHYHGHVKDNPAALLELPGIPRRLPRSILTVLEIELILAQALLHGLPGLRDRAVLETYYATGVRRMELAALKIVDLDVQAGLLTVNRGKGGKDRRVPIAERACRWIGLYLRHVRPQIACLESGMTLFLDNEGRAFRAHQLSRLASKYVKRAGIEKPGACNLFRHSTATLMHENGADLRHVQEMLGHADISTTQVYTHVTIKKLREVYSATHPAAFSDGQLNTPTQNRGKPL